MQQDESVSPNEFVDCEEYLASQDVYGELSALSFQQSFAEFGTSRDINEGPTLLPNAYPEDDDQNKSQKSILYDAIEESIASYTTSFTSSFILNNDTYSHRNRSKRHRDSQSPPSNPNHSKKQHHTAQLVYYSKSGKKDQRNEKNQPVVSGKAKAKASLSNAGDTDAWEQDDKVKERKIQNVACRR